MKRILLIVCVFIMSAACSESEEAAPNLAVNESILEFDNPESTQKIYVSSNTPWKTSTSEEWLTVSIGQYFRSDTLVIMVKENTGVEERSTYISISNMKETIIRTVKITQKPKEETNPQDI
ncbi:MAG: BACON domain-containing protein [Prevotellaceae bacterium]|jgi:hypothetical protein|nr:BACON domain-containing protein [Prevotellaceae bacterium]